MGRLASTAIAILPFLFVPIYVMAILEDRDKLVGNLAERMRVSAPEDIIGFGFWFNWMVMFAVPLALLGTITFVLGQRDARYWSKVVAIVIAISAIAAYYGLQLDARVLGRV